VKTGKQANTMETCRKTQNAQATETWEQREYITFPIKSSWKGYEKKWFYIRLGDDSVIKGKGLMRVVSDIWKTLPTVTDKMKSRIKRIRELREAGLTAAHVVDTFVRWRIVPLKNRDLACSYKGVTDPNRETPEGINLLSICSYSGICF
jgi:hypothetical protein